MLKLILIMGLAKSRRVIFVKPGYIAKPDVKKPQNGNISPNGVDQGPCKKTAILLHQWISSTSYNSSGKYIVPLVKVPEFESKNKLLKFFNNEVWEKGMLFSEDQDFLNEYIKRLDEIVEINQKYFSFFKARDKGTNILTFEKVFRGFKGIDESKLSRLQKAIYLTMATELILMGVNVTPILTKNNQECTNNRPVPTGFRQELLACWFVSKFLNKDKISSNQTNYIIPSIMLETIDRNKHTGEHEIDMLVQTQPFTMVSVKHNCVDRFPSKLKELVSNVACNPTLGNKIQKIIVISGSADPKQWERAYLFDGEYSSKKHGAIIEAKKLIDFNKFTTEQEKHAKTLLHEDNTNFHHIPFGEDENHLREWIRMLYREYLPETIP